MGNTPKLLRKRDQFFSQEGHFYDTFVTMAKIEKCNFVLVNHFLFHSLVPLQQYLSAYILNLNLAFQGLLLIHM